MVRVSRLGYLVTLVTMVRQASVVIVSRAVRGMEVMRIVSKVAIAPVINGGNVRE